MKQFECCWITGSFLTHGNTQLDCNTPARDSGFFYCLSSYTLGITDLPHRSGCSFEYDVCASESRAYVFHMGNITKYRVFCGHWVHLTSFIDLDMLKAENLTS